ncbi:ABC transporter substrate-binding protein [Mycetocola reblochoni]|uniref:Amino acid ABC transporter, periplasmic amino acid-binding protein n=2 Tax=Mycetocola reblochoni TaxID=331618 RepID=A0A1R4JL38_9MICO|nr:ABC transporter substrate-binding protein [Mycetocola reblochoni]RLP69206.1 amino acid ABC transporter substrate-binding protein [Mycetocola reblochoni]SJN32503.1 amino acid ABC transporter, periplasmic amino acid-binding protein [Mycetocola reblochoni REB411]
MTRISRIAGATAAVASLFLLSACASGTGDDAATTGPDALDTVTPGVLTIATGEPAYSPWVENDDPASGEGFEAAVAYAVAEKLGFAAEDVTWIRTPFDTVIAPGPKDFDLNIQQFSATDERRQAVDFSTPYYTTTQAVVTTSDSAAADADSLADLAGLNLGVAAGTSTLDTVNEIIAPENDPSIFNSIDDAVQAQRAGQIDAIVTDLPGAFYIAYGGQLGDDGVLVGQLDSTAGGDELSFLLEKDSPLTDAVSAAVDELREDGTLDELATTWIDDNADVPVLK